MTLEALEVVALEAVDEALEPRAGRVVGGLLGGPVPVGLEAVLEVGQQDQTVEAGGQHAALLRGPVDAFLPGHLGVAPLVHDQLRRAVVDEGEPGVDAALELGADRRRVDDRLWFRSRDEAVVGKDRREQLAGEVAGGLADLGGADAQDHLVGGLVHRLDPDGERDVDRFHDVLLGEW